MCVRTVKALVRLSRLAWALAARLCDKYHNLMSWLKCLLVCLNLIWLQTKHFLNHWVLQYTMTWPELAKWLTNIFFISVWYVYSVMWPVSMEMTLMRKCRWCGREFPTYLLLFQHRRVHSIYRPYVCSYATCCQVNNLKRDPEMQLQHPMFKNSRVSFELVHEE